MSSILRISSSSRAAVMAPPSMVSFPSIKKQVVRCLGSSPPWQPRTLICILVPEPLFHFQELQILLHLARVGHQDPIRDQRDDPGLGGLVHRLLDLRGGHAHPAVQLVEVDRDMLALRRVLAPLHRCLPQIVDHAAAGIAQEQVLDLLVGFLQPVRKFLDQADGDLHVPADHRLERLGIDHQQLRVLGDHGASGTRLVVQDAHLAEELSGAQGGEDLLGFPHRLGDVHLSRLDDVHLLARLPFPEQNLAALELPPETLEQRVLTRHGKSPISGVEYRSISRHVMAITRFTYLCSILKTPSQACSGGACSMRSQRAIISLEGPSPAKRSSSDSKCSRASAKLRARYSASPCAY